MLLNCQKITNKPCDSERKRRISKQNLIDRVTGEILRLPECVKTYKKVNNLSLRGSSDLSERPRQSHNLLFRSKLRMKLPRRFTHRNDSPVHFSSKLNRFYTVCYAQNDKNLVLKLNTDLYSLI